ncbi:MAG: serine/threonine protein kinase [Polyangiaceae bacterium]|nr:serine/threonine protein kinase [Polyangiaceae bacterium]
MCALPSSTEGPSRPSSDSRLPVAYLEGEIVGDKYRLEQKLGSGGMGTVWRARNLALDVDVAIKLIAPAQDGEQRVARLLREARAAARLTHPAIIRVFDFGKTSRGDPFIAMELLNGSSVDDVLHRQGRIPAARAVQIVLPIADALVLAHSRGIVHRDLKPDNVFLSDVDGRVQPKVLDFGIALAEYDAQQNRLTTAGTLVGSPYYMSPEQARGSSRVGPSADVWAFSVMLYEMVTARMPFGEDGNYNAVMRAIIEDEPISITQHAAGDEALWLILRRGLEKRPEDRWGSMLELGRVLAEWLLEHGIGEDICGQSLRACWSMRSSDETLARVSLSTSDDFRAPPSTRDDLRRTSDPKATLQRPSDPRVASLPPARGGRRATLLAVGGGAVAVAATTAWFVLTRPAPPPEASGAPTPASAPALAAAAPAESPQARAPSSQPTPAASEAAGVSGSAAAPPPAAPPPTPPGTRGARPTARATAGPAPATPPPTKPAAKPMLGDDLGF